MLIKNTNNTSIYIYNDDCMNYMKSMGDNSVDFTLTDIPYGEVSRDSNGLHEARGTTLDKGAADILTFDLDEFLNEVWRVTRGTIIIFCGMSQVSTIYRFFSNKQKQKLGTPRQLIWEKTNPAPFNGQYVYLSGIENAMWFRKSGGTFNANCKNTVFRHPLGSGKMHPTEKNHDLLKELILDNSKEGDVVFDPCMGSGSTGYVCTALGRNFIGCELSEEFFSLAKDRFNGIPYTPTNNNDDMKLDNIVNKMELW